jgi:hypothetical protein
MEISVRVCSTRTRSCTFLHAIAVSCSGVANRSNGHRRSPGLKATSLQKHSMNPPRWCFYKFPSLSF